MLKKAIHVRKLYDGSLNPPKQDVVVLIDGENIEDVVDVRQGKEWVDEGAEWIDASDKYMTPGLIDVHVHLMMKGNGEVPERTLATHTPGEIHLLALNNALTAMTAGVTTLRDCGSACGISRAVKKIVNGGFIPGPDVFISGIPVTRTGGHCHYMGGEADSEAEIRKLIRRQQKEGIDFVKLMGTTGGTIGIAGGTTYPSLGEYRTAAEEAHALELLISMHCCSIEGVRLAVDAGTDGIEHCMFQKEADGELVLDQALAERIAQQNIQVCHTLPALGSILWLLDRKPKDRWTPFNHSEYERISRIQEKDFKTILFHYKAGVQYVAGSDAGWKSCNYSLGLPLALEFMGDAGLPVLEIIHSATGRPAKYLRAQDRLGCVKKGLQADLLLLPEDPAEDMTVFHRVAQVYKKGTAVTNSLFKSKMSI